jgi:hypothetical protein
MSATAVLHPDLSRLDGEIRETLGHWETLVAGLSEAQFNWRPAPGRWSIAQNLAHLNTVDGLDLIPISTAIVDARSSKLTAPGPYRYGWHWRYFINSMEPPVKTKFKAPKKYVPPGDAPLGPTVAEFRRIGNALLDLIPQANGLDLARIKIRMAAAPLFRMPLGARFHLLAAHDRRHLWQARDVRNHPQFPA